MNFILIRHFETFLTSDGEEKIKFKSSYSKASLFVNFIKLYISRNIGIKKIKFFTSDYERTLVTTLIISSLIKTEIIDGNISNIKIYEPVINDVIDRDPKKKNKKYMCEYFKNMVNNNFDNDTVYIYITHSSVIYNLFKCVLECSLNKKVPDFNKRIYSNSISYISKNDNKVSYMFNKKIG